MARSQYALPTGTPGKPDRSDPRGKADLIRRTAIKYGIDPEVALRVAKSEGLANYQSTVVKKGVREPSWGAFQLYTGGGLGNRFQKETGLDPKDPKNEDATIDYALRYAAKHGWGSWYGAKNTGIGEFEGIKGGTQTAKAEPEIDPISGLPADSTTIKGTNTSTETPEVAQNAPQGPAGAAPSDFLTRLKDPQSNVSAGLGEAISGLGQAMTGASRGGDMYDTPSRAATIPAAMPAPAGISPIVDPRVAESQRQQLAMALKRLNSGGLY